MVLALKSSGWVLPRLLESEHPEPQPVGHKLGAIRQQLRLGDVLVVLRRPNALVQGGLGGRGGDSEQSRSRRIPRMRRRASRTFGGGVADIWTLAAEGW